MSNILNYEQFRFYTLQITIYIVQFTNYNFTNLQFTNSYITNLQIYKFANLKFQRFRDYKTNSMSQRLNLRPGELMCSAMGRRTCTSAF